MSSVITRLSHVAQQLPPDQIALADMFTRLSYSELIERVESCADWLAGLQARVIALHGENSIDWVIVDLACQQAGLICVPMPVFFSEQQIHSSIATAGVDVVISWNVELIKKLSVDAESLSLPNKVSFSAWKLSDTQSRQLPVGTQKITFTSGSTGNPKGVCLSDDHQWQVAQSLADKVAIQGPRHLCLLPLATLLENIAGVYSPLLSGGCVVLPNDAERGLSGSSAAEVKQLLVCIDDIQPQTLIIIPQLLSLLVLACQHGWRPPASLKFIAVGGGKVAEEAINTAQSYGLPVYQGYGLSECGSVVALNTPDSQRSGAVGQVLAHCKVSEQAGEIVVSGACHLGYVGDTDSWYPSQVFTGDIGYEQTGFLFVDGRQKNLLISSFGRNISPEWVESELMSTPLLSQCMVLGDARPYLVALLCAADEVTDRAIDHWIAAVNQKLPDYARVLAWARIKQQSIEQYLTANGRLQRRPIELAFEQHINQLYPQDYSVSCSL